MVRKNPLRQQALKNKGIQIYGEIIGHRRMVCQAKEKILPVLEGAAKPSEKGPPTVEGLATRSGEYPNVINVFRETHCVTLSGRELSVLCVILYDV